MYVNKEKHKRTKYRVSYPHVLYGIQLQMYCKVPAVGMGTGRDEETEARNIDETWETREEREVV